MKPLSTVKPRYPILLADLVMYLLAMKDRRPDIAMQARQAIQEGRYYEQN